MGVPISHPANHFFLGLAIVCQRPTSSGRASLQVQHVRGASQVVHLEHPLPLLQVHLGRGGRQHPLGDLHQLKRSGV